MLLARGEGAFHGFTAERARVSGSQERIPCTKNSIGVLSPRFARGGVGARVCNCVRGSVTVRADRARLIDLAPAARGVSALNEARGGARRHAYYPNAHV